jgi:hypothetical protein
MSLDVAVAPDITLTFGVPILIQKVADAESTTEGLRRAILRCKRGRKNLFAIAEHVLQKCIASSFPAALSTLGTTILIEL